MEDYNKIVEALGVRFIKSGNLMLNKPFSLVNFYDVENTIYLVNRGTLTLVETGEVLTQGDIVFLPAGRQTTLSFGSGDRDQISYEQFLNNKGGFYSINKKENPQDLPQENFSFVTFDAKVFDSVNFFSSLSIPPFAIRNNELIRKKVFDVLKEDMLGNIGKERVIKLVTEWLCVEVIRYIVHENLFVEQLATNTTYFKDPRLLKLFNHIKENLSGDLSNKVLAVVANVSEDYVGQYFKTLTGINPQDYIEYQRMERAVYLLRTSKDSIRDIGRNVGYKDTAYFCRRFKMMFGIPAGKMRRRESLINI